MQTPLLMPRNVSLFISFLSSLYHIGVKCGTLEGCTSLSYESISPNPPIPAVQSRELTTSLCWTDMPNARTVTYFTNGSEMDVIFYVVAKATEVVAVRMGQNIPKMVSNKLTVSVNTSKKRISRLSACLFACFWSFLCMRKIAVVEWHMQRSHGKDIIFSTKCLLSFDVHIFVIRVPFFSLIINCKRFE